MSNRNSILSAIQANQPGHMPLPDISHFKALYTGEDAVEKYTTISTAIGSSVYRVNDINEVSAIIKQQFPQGRIISNIAELIGVSTIAADNPHSFADVDLAIFKARFGVAENGALWVTEQELGERVLPFICQHLALIVQADSIISTMHQAYARIADAEYGYSAFISGPSKTADIEQSLVLGAHGPRSLSVFIVG